ncbi:MAG: Pirin-related protein [Candidatus Moranbacteria bacterium GW2011_GWE1_49_15]|nr:MAG: Pirin-related protein [Candidatus Moranbacteria bacterium GW2011_GWE2_47_10]KKW05848.1 MAG: Pirin-related protein [Candidatus Moranbacteria bacterium GW2011_GWE1_49_15]HBP01451.1 hypothetical protein [Candidatus Moranbacteria bacterium]
MQKIIHKAEDRAYRDRGWVRSYFSFSFAEYFNAKMMGFGALRVLNDDTIAPGEGFETHPHDNFEIMTVILSGALKHKDSEGHESVIGKGGVQLISAGSGISHSEFNASESEEVSLLQIWIEPNVRDAESRYQEGNFPTRNSQEKFTLVVAPGNGGNSLTINQEAYVSLASLGVGQEVVYEIKKEGNGVYVFIIDGEVSVEGEKIGRRDAVGLSVTDKVAIGATKEAQLILFEVPM